MLTIEAEHIRSMNFDRVAEAWADERFPMLQNNTLKQYYPCKNEAVSFFMDAPIAEISAMRIKSYLDMLTNKGFAKKTIKERYAVLKQIFTYAYEMEYIEKNPCATVKLKLSKDMASAKSNTDFYLTGKLFCGKCGSNMVGDSGTSHTGATHYYYSCIEHKRKHGCTKKSVKKIG